MPKKRLYQIATVATAALAATVALAVTTQIYAPLFALVIVAAGLVGITQPQRLLAAPKWFFALLAVVVLGLTTGDVFIDKVPALAGFVLVAAVLVGLAWRHQRAQFTTAPLGGAAITALERAGVALAEPVGPWYSGVTTRGAALLITEIDAEKGPVETWKNLRRVTTQAHVVEKSLKEEGLHPTTLVVLRGQSGVSKKVGSATLVSLDKLNQTLNDLNPPLSDFRAMADAAGVSLSRTTERALSRNATAKGPKTRVQHQGRVTKKNPS